MKKIFTIFTLLTLNAFADPKTCDAFRKNVLEKAIFEDPKEEFHSPYRFVKNEKEALKFIQQYDVKKLFLNDSKTTVPKDLKSCSDPQTTTYCDSLFPNYNFLQALTIGLKEYNWTKPTVAKGVAIAWAYVHETEKTRANLLGLLIAMNILDKLAEHKLIAKPTYEKLHPLFIELSRESDKLRTQGKDINPKDCVAKTASLKAQIDLTQTFTDRLLGLQ